MSIPLKQKNLSSDQKNKETCFLSLFLFWTILFHVFYLCLCAFLFLRNKKEKGVTCCCLFILSFSFLFPTTQVHIDIHACIYLYTYIFKKIRRPDKKRTNQEAEKGFEKDRKKKSLLYHVLDL